MRAGRPDPAAAQAAPPTLAQCHGIKDLAFVAHLDDDLLFMNPDIASNIEAGGCVRLVYLTASDAGDDCRERGVRAAYAYMAHQPDEWTEDTAGGHDRALHAQGQPARSCGMRLKDPWLGQGWAA